MSFSSTESDLLKQGPFRGRIDPWAEAARYFRPIHAGMIGALLAQIQDPLLAHGYVAGRETSLQIIAGREPDIYVRRSSVQSSDVSQWTYELAAEEILAEPGVAVDEEVEFEAIHIRTMATGDLVTVVEIVSPGNKTRDHDIFAYQERRARLFLEQGVNLVEVDATRSMKRLTSNPITATAPYHVAIFLPGESVRVIEIAFEQPLSRIALPLRGEVIPVELHDAYGTAYQQTTTAWHIDHEGRYTLDHLPFPTTLTDEQQATSLAAIDQWRADLARLRET